jgi:hypothetical protein
VAPTTESVRANFQKIRNEINDLFAGEGSPTGRDLVASSNLADLSSLTTARANLGLGSAALKNTSFFDQAGAASAALASANNYTDQRIAQGGGNGGGGGSSDDLFPSMVL